ncbi:hypothetical protein IC617_08320 [Neiella sp. HB171785]|uniref:Uncharacterized protein n=1 Tax=Neiella litorisoli TaxID=2771431 RepID=A0A8J6UED4_9GAMM|nr:hypothetical protein [Neiella litorisoli]MBD1389429.1 hypothetical protein [Neiella litorisoli]
MATNNPDAAIYQVMSHAEIAYALARVTQCHLSRMPFLFDYTKRFIAQAADKDARYVARLLKKQLNLKRLDLFELSWERRYNLYRDWIDTMTLCKNKTDIERLEIAFGVYEKRGALLTSLFGPDELVIDKEQESRFERYGLISLHNKELAHFDDDSWMISPVTVNLLVPTIDVMRNVVADLSGFGFSVDAPTVFRRAPQTNAIRLNSSRNNAFIPFEPAFSPT